MDKNLDIFKEIKYSTLEESNGTETKELIYAQSNIQYFKFDFIFPISKLGKNFIYKYIY